MSDQASGVLVIRPRKVRWAALVAAVIFVVAMVTAAVLLRTIPTGVYFRLADQIALVILGLLFAAGALLFTRPRVRADADGIEVRNLVLTKRFPWQVVAGVSFPDGAAWARLELPDDEYVSVMAIQAVDGEHAVAAIRELRAVHAQYAPPAPHRLG